MALHFNNSKLLNFVAIISKEGLSELNKDL